MSTLASVSCIRARGGLTTRRVEALASKNGSSVRTLSFYRRPRVVFVTASAAPKGVTQPTTKPVVPPPKFGFVENAERLNSRAAMIGFFALLLVEGIFNKGILEMVGITVGKGLDIGL